MKVRRVVTGHDATGRSVFVSDDEVDALTMAMLPGAEFHRLWGGDEPPNVPCDGREPAVPTYFPGPGGFRFGFFTLPVASAGAPSADLDVQAAMAEVETKLPGLLAVMEPDNPGMHTTDTVDFEVVLHGRVGLELDGGAEVELHPGDTVVQNGTRHRWHNRGDEPAVLAVFIVGAHRVA